MLSETEPNNLREVGAQLAPRYDLAGQVVIVKLPFWTDEEGNTREDDVPLTDPRVTDYLCRLFSAWDGKLPSDRRLNQAMRYLRGVALANEPENLPDNVPPRAPSVLEEAVMGLAESGPHQHPPEQLLRLLTTYARRAGLLKSDSPWPASADALGQQLARLVDVVASRGVLLQRGKSGGRYWFLDKIRSDTSDASRLHSGSKVPDVIVNRVEGYDAPGTRAVDPHAPGRNGVLS